MASANGSSTNENALEEWPSLKVACENNGQRGATSASNNNTVRRRDGRRRHTSKHSSEGSDSSKENENVPQAATGGGARPRTNWKPLQINFEPYKRRGTGRHTPNVNRGPRNEHRGNFREARGTFRGASNRRGRQDRGNGHMHHPSFSVNEQSPAANPKPYYEEGFDIINGVYYNKPLVMDIAKQLHDDIIKQVEYYFSDENLISDIYLRRCMDDQGFVDISLIGTFYRMRRLTTNPNVIFHALKDSRKLEVSADGKVRPVVNPLRWVLDHNLVQMYHEQYQKEVTLPRDPAGVPNPGEFNSSGVDSEIGPGVSGRNTLNMNGGMGSDLNTVPLMQLHFNSNMLKHDSGNLNSEPDVRDASEHSVSNSIQIEDTFYAMFYSMNIAGSVPYGGDAHMEPPSDCAIFNANVKNAGISSEKNISVQNSVNMNGDKSEDSISRQSSLNFTRDTATDNAQHDSRKLNGEGQTHHLRFPKTEQQNEDCSDNAL